MFDCLPSCFHFVKKSTEQSILHYSNIKNAKIHKGSSVSVCIWFHLLIKINVDFLVTDAFSPCSISHTHAIGGQVPYFIMTLESKNGYQVYLKEAIVSLLKTALVGLRCVLPSLSCGNFLVELGHLLEMTWGNWHL